VAGDTPTGKGVLFDPAGPAADVPMVGPARFTQAGESASAPTQTAPGDSQNPLRGLQIVPPTHWA
jgi:hypothetical protein